MKGQDEADERAREKRKTCLKCCQTATTWYKTTPLCPEIHPSRLIEPVVALGLLAAVELVVAIEAVVAVATPTTNSNYRYYRYHSYYRYYSYYSYYRYYS